MPPPSRVPAAARRSARTPYGLVYAHGLRHLDAERAHAWALTGLRVVAHRRALGRPLRAALGPADPRLAVHALGRRFDSPLGVAAGLDKDAAVYDQLSALGFGFVEVGTATARAQPGNPRPRIHRLPQARALLNSMGFPNAGADAVARRLRHRRDTVVGVNVGKSRDAALDEAPEDCGRAVAILAPFADYVVLNVSSPNTPGLRTLQAADRLPGLVDGARDGLRRAGRPDLPLLVKLAPDLADEELDAIADLAVERGLAGLVAVNTTLSRAGLEDEPIAARHPGGISGAPLKARALAVLERLHARAGDRLVLVSAGGIEDAGDAWTRIRAGATLLQAYTGFVLGGPLWAARVNRGLVARLEAAGASSLAEVRGSAR